MKIIQGDIWNFTDPTIVGKYNTKPVCVTTNQMIDSYGCLIMGRGIALDCKLKYPNVPRDLGRLVQIYGNSPFYLRHDGIISFPTKYDWRDKSDLGLIVKSAWVIKKIKEVYKLETVLSVWPGVGHGGLNKIDVEKVLSLIWDTDEFVIVDKMDI